MSQSNAVAGSSATVPKQSEFDEDSYLLIHGDVASAVRSGLFKSGWQHFMEHGFVEGRRWQSKAALNSQAGTDTKSIAGRGACGYGVISDISPKDEMFAGNEKHYFSVGASALHCVETALIASQRDRGEIRAILDLPCGHGRVLRFLKKAFPSAKLTACDLNEDGVRFCSEAFGAIPIVSKIDVDKITIADKFDLIWCGSLLTHLPDAKCLAFIRLFQRLLNPSGLLLFSVHGRICEMEIAKGVNTCGLQSDQVTELLSQYRQRGFGYVDYSKTAGYGISLSHPSFIMTNYLEGPGWGLLGFHEGAWDNRQDVVTFRKPRAPLW